MRSLVAMGYDMTEIKLIFEASSEESSAELQEEIKLFIYELNALQFDKLVDVDPADSALIYSIVEYIAKALLTDKRVECGTFISPGKVPMELKFESVDNTNETIFSQKKEGFITLISRGGLIRPSNYIYIYIY